MKVSKESFTKFHKVSKSFTKFQMFQKNTKKAENKKTPIASRILSDKKFMTLCIKTTMRAYECFTTKEYRIIVVESISTLNY